MMNQEATTKKKNKATKRQLKRFRGNMQLKLVQVDWILYWPHQRSEEVLNSPYSLLGVLIVHNTPLY